MLRRTSCDSPSSPPATASEFLHSLRSRDLDLQPWTDEELDRALSGVVGWPGFKDVFAVSATVSICSDASFDTVCITHFVFRKAPG